MTFRWLLLAIACSACASAEPSPSTAAAAEEAAPTWAERMRTVKAQLQRVERALRGMPQGDLVAAAHDAQDAAAVLRLGYGTAERRDVPGYARYARDAEAWLLQVGLEARSGHGELAAEQFTLGARRHCSACHDAVEQAAKGRR